MKYAPKGSLRQNLYSVAQMEWKKKLNLLLCIASDLQIIHSQNLIHRDLHSGNILQDNLYSAYIADLGLSISADIALKKEESRGVYGVLPYVAPEVLYGNSYTIKSDIYSFGIIMWEIVSGKAVPFDYESRTQFQFQVHDGLRPTIIEGTPQRYIDLMEKCWDGNPSNRPSAAKIYEIFTEWENDSKILLELTESNKISQNTENTHVQTAVYKSSFIPYTSYQGKYLLFVQND
jgi:serine/threonine protein kinase